MKALLTLAAISDATGESDHAQLEEIEIIFGAFEEIDTLALRQCRNLQRLIRNKVINCRLARISGLDSVGATLLHLSLNDQQLTRIEGLSALIHLRTLRLQQNRIEVIEGLQNCRKLQKLWLYGNRITKVENLAVCSDLRELWLQNNRIQTLDYDGSGVSALANLQSLHIANNQIRRFDEFQNLRKLLHLRELAFSDEHFGSNPIVKLPDYRAFAISTLKHLETLDGVPIDRSERVGAEDQFLAQALEFNDKLTSLTLAFENEMRLINGRRERGQSNAQMLQQELVAALNELEECITDGREQIHAEKLRQQRLREENTELLEENVENIKRRFCAAIEKRKIREASALNDEELKYEYLEQEALAEHRLVSAVTALQTSLPSKIAFQFLPDHSLDHRHIASHFRAQHQEQDDPKVDEQDVWNENRQAHSAVELLQIIRFYHRDLATMFENSAATQHTDPGEGTELYLYLVASEGNELDQYLRYGVTQQSWSLGFSHNGTAKGGEGESENDGIDDWLFLFSNPLQALTFYPGSLGGSGAPEFEFGRQCNDADHGQDLCESSEPRIETFRLLLCRVRMPQTIELFYPDKRHLSSIQSLHSVATPKGSILQPPPSAFLQLELGRPAGMRGGHVYMVRRARVEDNVLPQFLLLCSKRLLPPALKDPETQETGDNDVNDEGNGDNEEELVLGDRSSSASGILSRFQEALDAEVAAHHARLYAEIDPAQVRFRAQLLDQKRRLDEQLRYQRAQIENEKKLQDQLVRSLQSELQQQKHNQQRRRQ